jgi:hypothetical protein
MINTRSQPPTPPLPPMPSSSSSSSSRHRAVGSSMKDSILDRYEMGDKIGEGSFGIVYRATHKKSGALVRIMLLLYDGRVATVDTKIRVCTATL